MPTWRSGVENGGIYLPHHTPPHHLPTTLPAPNTPVIRVMEVFRWWQRLAARRCRDDGDDGSIWRGGNLMTLHTHFGDDGRGVMMA